MKKISAVLALLVLVVLLSAAAFADHSPYVVDDAGLFSGSERQTLETNAQQLSARLGMDVVILTTNNAGGKTATAYADDYYDNNGYGQGSDYDGILLLIDMDNREVVVTVSGSTAYRYFTDERQELILDDVFVYMPDGDYYNAAQAYLDSVSYWHGQGIPGGQHTVDEEGNVDYYRNITSTEWAIAAFGGLAAGGGFFGITMYRYRVGAKKSGFNIMENTALNLTANQDVFVNRTMSQRHIPRDTGGGGGFSGGGSSGRTSTYSSSSGRSHSSSSRKF